MLAKEPAIKAAAMRGSPAHFEFVAKFGHCLYAGKRSTPMVYITPVAVVPITATPLGSEEIGSCVL